MAREVTVTIESMAFRGYGVTRVNDKVIFIPYTVTGDKGEVEIVEEKKNYSFGRLSRIIEPSPWRRKPFCPYFGVCGGCQWQHIDYSMHGELREQILSEILKRLGGLKEIPSIVMSPSARPYGYRVRVQLRTKGETLGYYRERSHNIVDIDHCPIAHPLINQLIHFLRQDLARFSQMEEIEINVSPEEGKGVLILHPPSLLQGNKDFLKEFLETHPVTKGIAILRKERMEFLGDPSLTFPILLDQPGKKRTLRFRASPESFFQVNPDQNQRLIQTVLEFSEVKKDDLVLDLYAGIGNFTLPLAFEAARGIGIEENQAAVQDAHLNRETNGIKGCEFIVGRVEKILENWGRGKPDLVVLDPPRAGCKAILDQIVRLKPSRIIYVSCDPATFARDIRSLSETGYPLQRLAVIDMFPQSYHMEVVGLLKPPC